MSTAKSAVAGGAHRRTQPTEAVQTNQFERLKFVDQVPLARNRYFMAIAALHDALRSTPLFHKGSWLALATAVAVLAWRGRASPPGTFAISVAASGIVYILSFGVFGVAVEFRYAYWCVLASLAGLIPALLARRDPPTQLPGGADSQA